MNDIVDMINAFAWGVELGVIVGLAVIALGIAALWAISATL